jgi:hypothetical protein
VGVQEVIWDADGTKPAGEYTFFYGKGKEKSLIRPRYLHTSENRVSS